MAQNSLKTPMRKFGIVIVLAIILLIVAGAGAIRILSHHPKPVQGIDRSAQASAVSGSQTGLEAITKDNVEDTSMTVN